MKIKASYLDMMMEAFALSRSRKNNFYTKDYVRRTGISDIEMGVLKKMNLSEQQNAYYQSALMQQNAPNIQGLLGAIGQQGAYANLVTTENLQEYIGTKLKKPFDEFAEKHGFKYDFDTGSYIYPNGGYVTRRAIEDGIATPEFFRKQATPNISWLEDRVNEMRVKLT